MAVSGNKKAADLGGSGGLKPKKDMGYAYQVANVDKSRDDAMTRAIAKTRYETPSKVLDATEVRDTKRKDALTQALLKVKKKYVYTSGNLAARIKPQRRNNPVEEA